MFIREMRVFQFSLQLYFEQEIFLQFSYSQFCLGKRNLEIEISEFSFIKNLNLLWLYVLRTTPNPRESQEIISRHIWLVPQILRAVLSHLLIFSLALVASLDRIPSTFQFMTRIVFIISISTLGPKNEKKWISLMQNTFVHE